MSGRRSLASGVALLALGVGSSALVTPAANALPGSSAVPTRAADWCAPGAQASVSTVGAGFSAAECGVDDLTITDGPAAVRLPARGQTVSAEVLTTTGAVSLRVARDGGGTVTVTRGAPASDQLRAARTSPSACRSSGYALLGYRVKGAYTWAYNPAGAPSSVASVAVKTLTSATNAITSGRNDCGLRLKPRTSNHYAGATKSAPGIAAAAQCAGNDGRSVTGWKSLTAQGVLAVTCTYSSRGVVVASDAAINSRYPWTVPARSCHNAYDLSGVMTHERGHSFGLGHSTANAGLTMYPSVRPCDFSKTTLGKGDLLGMIAIYGAA